MSSESSSGDEIEISKPEDDSAKKKRKLVGKNMGNNSRAPEINARNIGMFPASLKDCNVLEIIKQGYYGASYRARVKRSRKIVTLQQLQLKHLSADFFVHATNEIQIVSAIPHQNIVNMGKILISECKLMSVFMDHGFNLKLLMDDMKSKNKAFEMNEVKSMLLQMLAGVAHLHDKNIFHSKLCTYNLMLTEEGFVKISCNQLVDQCGLLFDQNTVLEKSHWYVAPELLLGQGPNSRSTNMWSVGCIFAELLLMNSLFRGESILDQYNEIFKLLGSPNNVTWPGFSQLPYFQGKEFVHYPASIIKLHFDMLTPMGVSLMEKFLMYDPKLRISAHTALEHLFFMGEPLPIDREMLWPRILEK